MELLMYRILHNLMNLLVGLIAIWAIFVSSYTLLGTNIYFPFSTFDGETVPYHRWQTVRVAVFITVAYFSILHLFRGSKEYYPIQVLEIYLKNLTVVGLVVFYQTNVDNSEYFVVLFFGITSFILHLANRKKYKYFAKKHNHFM